MEDERAPQDRSFPSFKKWVDADGQAQALDYTRAIEAFLTFNSESNQKAMESCCAGKCRN